MLVEVIIDQIRLDMITFDQEFSHVRVRHIRSSKNKLMR